MMIVLAMLFLCPGRLCFAAQIIGVEEERQAIISDYEEYEPQQNPQVSGTVLNQTQSKQSNHKKSSVGTQSNKTQNTEFQVEALSNNTIQQIVSENNLNPKIITYRIRHYVQRKQGGSFSLFLEEYAKGENGKVIYAPVCKKAIDYVNQIDGRKCEVPVQRKVKIEKDLLVSYYYSCVADVKKPVEREKTREEKNIVLSGKEVKYVLKKLASGNYELKKIDPAVEKKLVIPEKIKVGESTYLIESIGESFLEDNLNVCQVTIPSSVEKIGKKAFYHCGHLRKIKIKSHVLDDVGENAFAGCHSKLKFDVPAGYISHYQTLLCENKQEENK